tara:strand:- start:64 stop:468 length:405 start_codon:yes stop_codon:yes gene_type:complete
MGYCIFQRDGKFKIASADKAGALSALKKLSKGDYAWVDHLGLEQADTLEQAIRAWRWHATTDEQGNIDDLYFNGEKYGDEEVLLKVLALYAESGSWVEMQGEDGERWMWKFERRQLVTYNAKITFDEPSYSYET